MPPLDGFLREVLLGGVFEPNPRMAQELPAQLVAVTAVGRVGEEPFLQVGTQHFEEVTLRGDPKVGEYALFQLDYQGILHLGGAFGEGNAAMPTGSEIQRCQTKSVSIGLILVCASQSPVQVGENSYPYRSRTVLIGWEETFEDRRSRPCLIRGQNQQG